MYHAIPRKRPWNNGRFFYLFLILAQKNRAFICIYQKKAVPLQPKIIIMYYGNFVSLTKSNSLVPYATRYKSNV